MHVVHVADPPAGGQVPQDWRMELDGLPPGSHNPGQYQQQHQRQHGGQRGRGARGGQQRHQRHPEPEPGKPVEGCWFCLSSDQVCVGQRGYCGVCGAERVRWLLWGRGGCRVSGAERVLWRLLQTVPRGRAVCSWGCIGMPCRLLVIG